MLADIVILAVIGVLFFFSARKIITGIKKGQCGDCSGGCSTSCGGSCSSCGHQCGKK